MSTIDKSLKIIAKKFQKDSKRYLAARYIVKQNRKIPKNERDAICDQIPIAKTTLRDLFTELRKLKLYPPQETSDISYNPPTPEMPEETSHHVPEAPKPPLQEYATKEDFETLKNSINYLASVISGEPSSNPDESEEDIEVIPPEEVFIQEPSLTKTSIYLKPKTQLYFDMSRQGVFANYAGSRELGPLTQFDGNLSDFFNTVVDDYFLRNYNADIGILMRRYAE